MSYVDTAQWYRQFAEKDARGSSPTYERLALAVSQDEEVLSLLDTLSPGQRQPNTLFDALVWPEHTERRERLHRAAAIVAADPPQAPVEATLVVFHSSVLYQVPPDRRAAFVDFMRRLDRVRWVAIEGPDVLPYADLPSPPADTVLIVLALDEVPLAWTRGHGQELVWFGPDVTVGSGADEAS